MSTQPPKTSKPAKALAREITAQNRRYNRQRRRCIHRPVAIDKLMRTIRRGY